MNPFERLRGREHHIEAAILAGLTLFVLATTVPNIANDPIAGGDEGWIISASAKLAEDGIFGSDLFSGFFGAERHYYFNLPLHHLVLAGVFKVFGVGLAQARLASLAFGLTGLALIYLLGRRIGGRWVGLGAAGLLVLLRLNLTPFTGLTLTDLGATVRYDLIAVPFALASALILLRDPEGPTPREAALAGFVLGLGCLTQFIDAFFVLPLAAFLLTSLAGRSRRILMVAVFLGAVAAPFLPYLAFIAQDWHDFRGQSRAVEQRTDLLSPSFYWDNLTHEADRYELAVDLDPISLSGLAKRPSARLVLLVAAPLALVVTIARARAGSRPHRLMAMVLVALVLEFALFESTKRFVYWVIVVPFLCVALADTAGALASWRPRSPPMRRFVLAGTATVAALFALEGLAVGLGDIADAGRAAGYRRAGDEVRAVVPPGSTVVTDNRLWLALRDMEPRSLHLLFYWTNPRIAEEEVTDVEGAMRRIDADYLLLSPLTREILRNLSASDSAEFERYLKEHGRLVATVSQKPYGPIEVYELRR